MAPSEEMKKVNKTHKYTTVRAWRLPPLKQFTFTSLLELSRLLGEEIRLRYNPRQREFLLYVPAGTPTTQNRLRVLLQAFPEQTIRL